MLNIITATVLSFTALDFAKFISLYICLADVFILLLGSQALKLGIEMVITMLKTANVTISSTIVKPLILFIRIPHKQSDSCFAANNRRKSINH